MPYPPPCPSLPSSGLLSSRQVPCGVSGSGTANPPGMDIDPDHFVPPSCASCLCLPLPLSAPTTPALGHEATTVPLDVLASAVNFQGNTSVHLRLALLGCAAVLLIQCT